MRPPDGHHVDHAATPDQQDVLRRQVRPDIGNAGLFRIPENANTCLGLAGTLIP